MTHSRSWVSSFLKTESITSFMKTTFHSSSASARIHPRWFCAEPQKKANKQLSSWAWWERQGGAGEGAFWRRSWRDLLFSPGGAAIVNNLLQPASRPSTHPIRPNTKRWRSPSLGACGRWIPEWTWRDIWVSPSAPPARVDQWTA